MSRKTELALVLAAFAHEGQTDKAGVDYIEHPKTVAATFTDENRIIVALLHDVLEDTFVTESTIRNLFGDEIADACRALTHADGEPYLDYVQRAIGNPIARDVKKADLLNNMDLKRLPIITAQDTKRIREKYIPALELIMKHEEGQKNATHEFALKWLKKFGDEAIDKRELLGEDMFDDCKRLGFEMDCGHAFGEEYGTAASECEDLRRVIDQVTDIQLLGSAIFSQWRYFNHWADPGEDICAPENRFWFIIALNRLAELTC